MALPAVKTQRIKPGTGGYGAAILLVLLVTGLAMAVPASARQPAFPGLDGPQQQTSLPPNRVEPTSPQRYADGGSNSLAVFLRDAQSSWLGIAHGLKAAGVPFIVTRELETALEHDVVLLYPSLTGANAPRSLTDRLQAFVEEGNTLIAFSVIGRGMSNLFGYTGYRERDNLQWLEFDDNPLTEEFLPDSTRRTVNLAARGGDAGGVSYRNLEHPPLARFDDGTAAIIHKPYVGDNKAGLAVAVGFDIGHFTLRAFNGRITGVEEDYVNAYHDTVDSLFRFLAALYWQGEADPVQFRTTAYNHDFTVLITHDIDFTRSMKNIRPYVDLEVEQGVPATYFIQTKYVTDYNDQAFFDSTNRPIIEYLVNHGMAIGSHSVAHSNEFRHMPIGTGAESYPGYQPFVKDFATVNNASIAGELRVSGFLLEHLGSNPVTAFRPGHLSLPRNLPEMLEATGYQFSSSITANEALTHLPYQTMFSSEYHAETSVYEFPVTIEDEDGDLLDRLDASIALARRIGRHGGLVNLLIHTDEADRKLQFQRRFVEAFRDQAWFTTLPAFGDWWRARDSLQVDVEAPSPASRKLAISTNLPTSGIGLLVPRNWILDNPPAGITQTGNQVLIDRLTDETVLLFQVQ